MYSLKNLMIKLSSKFVGEDELGNRYYIARFLDSNSVYRRRVIYKDLPESSKIPEMWHGWLHYSIDKTPEIFKYVWQGKHKPNLTGSKFSHQPHKNSTFRDQKPYQAWKPQKKETFDET